MKITPAAILRARAWEALKVTWPIVLAGSALINLVSFVLNQVFGVIPVIGAFLGILVTALLMVPMMGLTKGVLDYYRGQTMTFDCVKSMFHHWQKVCLYYLWEMLCALGWVMLGAIPMFIGAVMMASESMEALGILLMLAGIVLMLVLGIRAGLDYSMAQGILMDDPSVGVRELLKKSRAMIHGYRWHYVKVSLPVFIIIFVVVFIIGVLTAALPAWLSSLFSSAISVFSGMLGYYFFPVMYEELKRIGR